MRRVIATVLLSWHLSPTLFAQSGSGEKLCRIRAERARSAIQLIADANNSH